MKVVLIHQAFVSSDEAGGTRHFELAKYCAQRGIRFKIITSPISYLTGQVSRLKQGMPAGIEVDHSYTVSGHHKNYIWRVLAFVIFMFTSIWHGIRSRNIDLVMGTTPPIFQAISAWLVSAVKRKPFLLEIRDLWPEFAIDMGIMKNKHLIWASRHLENILYAKADLFLVNSPAYRDYLVKKGVIPERIHLIPNGADSHLFDVEDANLFRSKHGLQGRYLLIYAGALGIANDIETLLKSILLLRGHLEIHLVLAGDGKEREHLQEWVRQNRLANVTFLGAIPKSDIPKLLSEADACVAILKNIPMFRTTYPNKVFDYMAAGKPLILGIDGVIRDVVEKARCGICVKPGDPASMASGILYLMEHPDIARTMGKNGRRYVKKHFDRIEQAEQFRSLILSMKDWNFKTS